MREQQDQGEEDLAERTGVSVCRIERLLEAIPTSAAHVASHRTVKHPSAGANPEKPRTAGFFGEVLLSRVRQQQPNLLQAAGL